MFGRVCAEMCVWTSVWMCVSGGVRVEVCMFGGVCVKVFVMRYVCGGFCSEFYV